MISYKNTECCSATTVRKNSLQVFIQDVLENEEGLLTDKFPTTNLEILNRKKEQKYLAFIL